MKKKIHSIEVLNCRRSIGVHSSNNEQCLWWWKINNCAVARCALSISLIFDVLSITLRNRSFAITVQSNVFSIELLNDLFVCVFCCCCLLLCILFRHLKLFVDMICSKLSIEFTLKFPVFIRLLLLLLFNYNSSHLVVSFVSLFLWICTLQPEAHLNHLAHTTNGIFFVGYAHSFYHLHQFNTAATSIDWTGIDFVLCVMARTVCDYTPPSNTLFIVALKFIYVWMTEEQRSLASGKTVYRQIHGKHRPNKCRIARFTSTTVSKLNETRLLELFNCTRLVCIFISKHHFGQLNECQADFD